MTSDHSVLATHWDIFCRVVDNFGDIGVCWRLARGLARDHGIRVRLWTDDWKAFARLCREDVNTVDVHRADGVEVRRWDEAESGFEPGAVVVEAFACELPEACLQKMARSALPPRWINLEYLSAEQWVGGCHRMRSPHPRLPLVKHFFFPGFAADTGGLLRERGLFAARERFLADPLARAALFAQFGVAPPPPDALTVSLFAYEQPDLMRLIEAWAAGPRPVCLLVPEGRVVRSLAQAFGCEALPPGHAFVRGALRATVVPFVDQDRYDRLLWSCDLNFVRGEDSFVRAQWAARPLVWHIYPQQEDAHFDKLDAFLQRYCAGLAPAAAAALRGVWLGWNGRGDAAACWAAFAANRPVLDAHARRWAEEIGGQTDLVTSLVDFVAAR